MAGLLLAEQSQAIRTIDAASSEVYKKVFFLGPYARRVSFASQQNRALNLVWALDRMGKISKPEGQTVNIAVIGAGLSGVTTCAALADLGYSVYLYESGTEVLHRQSETRHRYIHPTVNQWPEIKLHPTTQLPYFDWICGLCSELMKLLKEEWNGLVDSRNIKFSPSSPVTAFYENDEDVAVAPKGKTDFDENRYQAVIVTSGFDDEVLNASELTTYWQVDNNEADVIGGQVEKVFVSGCGDGGLIDALRIAHKEFECGQLIVDVAEILNPNNWPPAKEILAAEAKISSEIELLNAIENGSESLQTTYKDAARKIPDNLADKLKRSLRFGKAGFVTLFCRERYPYSPMASPIHKLLLAHAMNSQVIVHMHCEVIAYKQDEITYTPHGKDPKLEENWEKREGRVIVRHGAEPNFSQFFIDNRDACTRLIYKQKLTAEDLDKPYWSEGVEALKSWPPKEKPFDFADLETRLPHAKKLVTLKGINAIIEHDENIGFRLIYANDVGVTEKLSALPDRLFGFPLKTREFGTGLTAVTEAYGSTDADDAITKGILSPGAKIASALNGRLGPLVKDKKGRLFGLSVAHVLFVKTKSQIKEVISDFFQSIGSVYSTSPQYSEKAELSENIGVIKINPANGFTSRYLHFPSIGDPISEEEVFGKAVLVLGRDGKMHEGDVSDIRTSVILNHPTFQEEVLVENAVRVTSKDRRKPFAKRGDSGAPVVDTDGRLLGLVFSGNEDHTYVLPVKNYLEEHGLVLVKNDEGPVSVDPQVRESDLIAEKPSYYEKNVRDLTEFRRAALTDEPLDLDDASPEINDG